ncbi:uncharacterized protein LOC120559388 [Perca fluviatilis]|uniref:uncharacterized protein LOC120559388 n=1 Tax=Perca fluviatilis TaxID=8168 RepID=UPI001965EBC2|nr:uncharacterized protein LOC120559388 [Perca fluviatilis]XP_039657010.1 uncharacterized protein LOC120559388 [Perca fluviatilis]
MSNPSDDDGFIKINLPKNPSFFFIERNDWEKLKKNRQKRSFKGLQWTNIISKGLRTIHPYCSIAFKRHKLKVMGSIQASPEFSCLGYCRFEDCPVTVTVTVDSEEDLKAIVEYQGEKSIHNLTELKRRPVRAHERKTLGEDLQRQLPRAMYLDKITKIHEDVMESGCRDEAPSPNVLKNISWEARKRSRQHSNEVISLQIMLDQKKGSPDEVLQKVMLHPKGVLLWSRRGIEIYQERCQEDIVYLDATGSIMRKQKGSPPFYVYELVVRNPHKNSSPLPVATYLTCDHTTASVNYFLEAFQTDVARCFGRKGMQSPIMILCDGSMVLMQAICLSFAKKNLKDTINHYYNIASGKGKKEDFVVPILHRCLSHVMKNAKEMCRKYAPKHYHLAMHVFGSLTTASTLIELDDMVQSAAVVFSSPSCGPNVEKHFKNLQSWMQRTATTLDETTKSKSESLKDIDGVNRFATRCKEVISNAPLDMYGEPNVYFCRGLIEHLNKYLLPYSGLWTGIMLGDLGRHGTGPQYEQCSRKCNTIRKLPRQNITEDNRTQGIMEKSQWDLKHIRFPSGRLTRLDDFVSCYQTSHTALLKEYEDSERVVRRKTYRVDQEKWKERQQKKRGRYVTPLRKPFHFKTSNKKVDSSVPDGAIGKPKSLPQPSSSVLGDHEETLDGKDVVHGDMSNKPQTPSKTSITPQHQLRRLSSITSSY